VSRDPVFYRQSLGKVGILGIAMIEIVTHPIDIATVTAAVADTGSGATVTFIGTTRDHNDGRRVTRLEYEAYPEMAVAEMRKIGALAHQRWPLTHIAIVH